ncbi:MAG: hypothetical protein HF975_04500 [ANME-2 cluster archaeon]|nr:hypothetical protein [ANME-2 cluster archaeon]
MISFMPAVLRVVLSASTTSLTRPRMVWAASSFVARIDICKFKKLIVMPPTLAPASFWVGSDTVKISMAGIGVLVSLTPAYMLAPGTMAVRDASATNASLKAFRIDFM